MKNLLLSLVVIVSMVALVKAAALREPQTAPLADSKNNPAIFYSTNTNSATFPADVVVSSLPYTYLHTVNINTGGATSKLEIFDSKTTTSAAGIRKIATIDTSSATQRVPLVYDVYLASGLAINNQGNPPADITISFKQ